MSITFRQNIPHFRHGLGVSQISFSGGRVAASIAAHGGFTHLDYYGRQRLGCTRLYQADPISAWGQLFRLVLDVDGELFYLEFNDTAIYPYGYHSCCTVGGVTCRHRLTLLNDALVLEVEVTDAPAGKPVAAQLLLGEQAVRVTPAYRTWENFVFDTNGNTVTAVVRDQYPPKPKSDDDNALTQRDSFGCGEPDCAETFIGVTADQPLSLQDSLPGFKKIWVASKPFAGQLTLVIAFGHEPAEFNRRLAGLRGNAAGEAAAVRQAFQQRLKHQPQINVADKTAQSLLTMTGAVVDSLKVKDLPGAIRAADSGYWVWGWDSMVYSDAMLFVQDAAAARDMLAYYRRLAHPRLGIPHAITLDGNPLLAMAFPAQCLYAVLLYNTYVFTGDRALLAEFFPFAASLVRRAVEQEVGETGLVRGVSLYPDFPECLGQDGEDLSVFNNSIFYQALRALATLAEDAGVPAEAAEFTAHADRLAVNFERFLDPQTGYFVDSLSARDFSPRRHYPVYALLWVTPFAHDLVRGREQGIAAFMRQHFPARHGVRLFPRWDECFYRDGNQLGMYMPVIEPFYLEMMRLTAQPDAIPEWFANLAWFWRQLTIPEALTCEMANHGLTVDNPGRKQAFCVKAWYSMFMHAIAGIEPGLHGIQFTPSDAGDIAIRRLQIRGHLLDIRIQGRGWDIGELRLNGVSQGRDGWIPYALLGWRNTIEIRRNEQTKTAT